MFSCLQFTQLSQLNNSGFAANSVARSLFAANSARRKANAERTANLPTRDNHLRREMNADVLAAVVLQPVVL